MPALSVTVRVIDHVPTAQPFAGGCRSGNERPVPMLCVGEPGPDCVQLRLASGSVLSSTSRPRPATGMASNCSHELAIGGL